MNRVGARFDASVGGAGDHTRHRFSAEHEARLYNDARTLRGTQRTRVVREPLVFRFTTQRRNLFGLRRPQHPLLSFLDTAGEDLHTAACAATTRRYLHRAARVPLRLAPLRMADAPRLADPGARIPLSQGPEDQPLPMLERVTEL